MYTKSRPDKRVMWITVSVFAFLATLDFIRAQAQVVECTDQSGTVYQIPEGKKPILVPAWLDPERVIIQSHIADPIGDQVTGTGLSVCDPDELAVSPSVCTED